MAGLRYGAPSLKNPSVMAGRTSVRTGHPGITITTAFAASPSHRRTHLHLLQAQRAVEVGEEGAAA